MSLSGCWTRGRVLVAVSLLLIVPATVGFTSGEVHRPASVQMGSDETAYLGVTSEFTDEPVVVDGDTHVFTLSNTLDVELTSVEVAVSGHDRITISDAPTELTSGNDAAVAISCARPEEDVSPTSVDLDFVFRAENAEGTVEIDKFETVTVKLEGACTTASTPTPTATATATETAT